MIHVSQVTIIRIRCVCSYEESGLEGADIGKKIGLKWRPQVDSSLKMLKGWKRPIITESKYCSG